MKPTPRFTLFPPDLKSRLSTLAARFRAELEKLAGDRRRLGVLALLVLLLPPGFLFGEALIRAHLDPVTERPAAVRVYGRPLLLERGDRPDPELVEAHLRAIGYRTASRREVGIGEYYLGPWGWIIGRRPFRGAGGEEAIWARDLRTGGFLVVRLGYGGRITGMEDQDGRSSSRAFLEPELIGRLDDGSVTDRLPVHLADVPSSLVDAVLTVEDQRFWDHHGLDLRRIGGAAVANLKVGRVVQGGSTLTQQLAKTLFLSPRRTLDRKLREAALALALEARHSKEEILEGYLNEVYLGQEGAVEIRGVGRAAEYFFGKPVGSLDLAESALLVALIRAPSLYSPIRNPETALERRNLVLSLMRDAGRISDGEMEDARDAPLRLRSRPEPIRSARYFVDAFVADLPQPAGGAGDGAIVTTLDPRLQRAAEKAVKEGLARLERDFDWLREAEAGEPLQAALVAMDPRSGEILAMVGGREYGTSQFNRAVAGRRQPGSAFKPVVALAALARPDDTAAAPRDDAASSPSRNAVASRSDRRRSDGRERRAWSRAASTWEDPVDTNLPRFTLASVLEDAPLQVETPAGLWQPANYDGDYEGPVTLRTALERSLNVPFARLGLAVGPERIVETARSLGIESPLRPYPSLALGAEEVSPLELTRAFGVLAAGGFRAELETRYEGPRAPPERVPGERVFDPQETYLVTSALQGAVERGTGRSLRTRGFQGDVAAKSGTTNDFRDGWFVGYTSTLVVGVWVGFDHGGRLELPGAGVALPIFGDFLQEAVGRYGDEGPWGSPGFSRPAGLEVVEVNTDTGLRAGWGCSGEPELFLEGTAPRESCSGFWVDGRGFRSLVEQGEEEAFRLLRRIFGGSGRDH